MFRVRGIQVAVDGGSADHLFSTDPARYAGAYFRFDPPTLSPTVEIHNMGRDLYSGAPGNDHLDELTPANEKLISGLTDVAISGGVGGGTAYITIFIHD